jgi:hypothetical protein
MMALMNNEIESLTGVKSFSGGISGAALGNTATSARGAMDAAAVRRLNTIRNIAENIIKPLMRKWLAYDSEFLSEEEIVRYTEDEFIQIRRDDLQGKLDIGLTISSREEDAAKAQELAFMLQTTGQDDPEYRKMVQAEIARLQKMPDFAKRLEEYKPEPDPMQEEMKQQQVRKVQLENALLEAEIASLGAVAEENRADYLLKMQKAKSEAAKARKLESEADMTDVKYLKEDGGYAHLEKLELADQKHAQDMERRELEARYNMLLAQMQQKAGDDDIGLMRR